MKLMNEIPDRFWGLFRSVNRPIYIEALLRINEEYEYSNYFLSREACVKILGEHFAGNKYVIWQDELEEEPDTLEPPATRVLNWLLRAGWLRKVDDYLSMTANIVIPDYAAVMLDAFARLQSDEEDETQIYVQNIYAILFSLKNDKRAGISLLNTALLNTKKLNKALQDMLHNMDKFFSGLLEQKTYGNLLQDHLEGYVEEIVRKKYHILKTSDNFYLYKNDIKYWIGQMREDVGWLEALASENDPAGIYQKLNQIERGFDDIEHRISNMDREHSRYVRATVTRLHYLLNQEDNTKGLILRLLNHLSDEGGQEEKLKKVGARMNLSQVNILSGDSLYKRRKVKSNFIKNLEPDEEEKELTTEEILSLNRLKNRYSRGEIEAFIAERSMDGRMEVGMDSVGTDEDFEKLILAYDYSTRQNSLYRVEEEDVGLIDNGRYRYPKLVFVRRNK